MRTYTIVKKPEVLDWSDIPAAPIDHVLWEKDAGITAQARVCYDDTALYVQLSAQEKDVIARQSGPLGEPCLDSCLEFFFSPAEGDLRYFNIEFSPACCMYLGMGDGKGHLYRLLCDWGEGLEPQAMRTQDGWQVTYRVPFSLIRVFFPDFAPQSGSTMRGNFYKCGDETPQPHFMAWNEVACERPAFHRPQDFGLLVFG